VDTQSLLAHILSEIKAMRDDAHHNRERQYKTIEKIEAMEERLSGIEFEFKVFKRAGMAVGTGVAAFIGFFMGNAEKVWHFIRDQVV